MLPYIAYMDPMGYELRSSMPHSTLVALVAPEALTEVEVKLGKVILG
jgi:hypothetical protein